MSPSRWPPRSPSSRRPTRSRAPTGAPRAAAGQGFGFPPDQIVSDLGRVHHQESPLPEPPPADPRSGSQARRRARGGRFRWMPPLRTGHVAVCAQGHRSVRARSGGACGPLQALRESEPWECDGSNGRQLRQGSNHLTRCPPREVGWSLRGARDHGRTRLCWAGGEEAQA
jgi:hypothetical protein